MAAPDKSNMVKFKVGDRVFVKAKPTDKGIVTSIDKDGKVQVSLSAGTSDSYAANQLVHQTDPSQKSEKKSSNPIGDVNWTHVAGEIAWNTVHVALVRRLILKEKITSRPVIRFAVADAAYELFQKQIKSLFARIGLKMESLQNPQVPESFIGKGDFMDGLKALPITVFENAIKKVMGGSFQSGFLKTLAVNYGSITLANVTGRMISGMRTESKFQY